ncbi:hypothetical protein GGI21_004474, partial [Coemansia aciculifera]
MTVMDSSRIVLITGCSEGGIGHALALEFAAQGCVVFAGVRTPRKAQALASSHALISVVELDITSAASIDAAISHVLEATGGRIDILVNNAGVFCVGPACEVPPAQVQQAFDTNVVGLARMCHAVAPLMMDRRQGTIVNIGSVSGYVATPWVGVYAATKAAVHAYSDSLRMELRPFGVNVVVVAPGSIKSNLVANMPDPMISGSRYGAARPAIEARAGLSQASDTTPADCFARKVVSRLMRSSSPPSYITRGTHAVSIWLGYYVPPAIRDFVLGRRFGTRQLARDLESTCPVSGKKSSTGGKCPMSSSSSSSCAAPSCPITSPKVLGVCAVAAAAAVA